TRCYRDWSSDVCSSDLRGARGVREVAVVAVRLAERQADGRDRGHAQAVRRVEEGPRAALPRQGREAAARRRAAARRDEDGQGLRSEERRVGKEGSAVWS